MTANDTPNRAASSIPVSSPAMCSVFVTSSRPMSIPTPACSSVCGAGGMRKMGSATITALLSFLALIGQRLQLAVRCVCLRPGSHTRLPDACGREREPRVDADGGLEGLGCLLELMARHIDDAHVVRAGGHIARGLELFPRLVQLPPCRIGEAQTVAGAPRIRRPPPRPTASVHPIALRQHD